MFLPLFHEAIFFLGIFGLPALLFVLLARYGQKFILFILGVVLLFVGIAFLNSTSWFFSLLYLVLGGLALAHAGLGWSAGDYGLTLTTWRPIIGGLLGGTGLALIFLAVTGTLGQRLAGFHLHLLPIPILATFTAALVPGVWEEFVFRGVIQGEVRHLFRSPWPAIIMVAALFTIFHSDRLHAFGDPLTRWIYLAFVLAGACVTGRLREGYGLLPAILFHTFYNWMV